MNKNCCAVFVTLLLLSLAPIGRAQTVIFVDRTANGGDDGTSWEDAFTELSDALTAASGMAGSRIIRVAKGTYQPDTTGLGDPRTATFAMQADLEILGGYPGHSAADPDLRNAIANATILSGDIGVAMDNTDNCYHVVTASGVPETGVLDGFRIRDGYADGTVFPHAGGGDILVDSFSLAVIRNCVVRDGYSDGGGSGIHITSSSPTFENVVVYNNQANNGGGVWATGGGTPRFERCRFDSNVAMTANGAAVYCNGAVSAVFVGCTFVDNTAHQRGGAFYCLSSEGYFVNCLFLNNEATTIGGGGIWSTGSEITVVNSVFSGNFADAGGAIATEASTVPATQTTLTVVNCTIAYNDAATIAGGIHIYDTTMTLLNSILYFNTDGVHVAGDELAQLKVTIPYTFAAHDFNCIQGYAGAFGGAHNITTDPQFVDADGADNTIGTIDDDFRLPLASPCIDAGSNADVAVDAADVDGDGDDTEPAPLDAGGDPRFEDQPTVADTGVGTSPVVDIGALERGRDCDANGMVDADEIAANAALDCDANGMLDICETDSDSDGLIDACDNCPATSNASQNDSDADGVGDECDVCQGNDASGDADADGVCDDIDPCPMDNPDDSDGDGICDSVDPCPLDNPDDSDGDGVCDSVDPCPTDNPDDSDGDGVCDSADPCPSDNPDDTDGDGVCDSADPCPNDNPDDSDGDGICDSVDECPADAMKSVPGACGCGVADVDDDGNGTPDCMDNPISPAVVPQMMTTDCCAAGSGPLVSLLMPIFLGIKRRRRRRRRCCAGT